MKNKSTTGANHPQQLLNDMIYGQYLIQNNYVKQLKRKSKEGGYLGLLAAIELKAELPYLRSLKYKSQRNGKLDEI